MITDVKLHGLYFINAVLTVALWIIACPRPIIIAGAHAVSFQYIPHITFIGSICTNSGWSFIWLVAHRAIHDVQQRTRT